MPNSSLLILEILEERVKSWAVIGSLSNRDNDDVKKQSVSWAKQQVCTTIMLFSTFFGRSLYDYDVIEDVNITQPIFLSTF